jgi:3-hydroxybutyryl-CoA dehydrogenase
MGMNIRSIAVIGAGTMGCGIARAAAAAGFTVILEDRESERAEKGRETIQEGLDKKMASGKLESGQRDEILARVAISDSLADCRDVDLIIEAASEKEGVKKDIFRALDAVCRPDTIFSSNTSSISITRLAQVTSRPERFIGMHFMNPAHVMRLVELISGERTSEETITVVSRTAEAMGKVPVLVGDSPGFVSNRVLMPMIDDAVFCIQEGVATRESIDTIVMLGANHPMGPLELADFVGLDICLEIMEVLHSELGEKYRPCPLLRRMVAAGKLGRKTGEGFYEYP